MVLSAGRAIVRLSGGPVPGVGVVSSPVRETGVDEEGGADVVKAGE